RLFASGVLPAIDVTKSVSRVGGKSQHPHIKKTAGRMKLDYLQFLELEVFTRFGSRLEASMEAKIKRGRILREIFKQERLSPLPIEFHMAWLVAFQEGLFDNVPTDRIQALLGRLAVRVKESHLTVEDGHELWAPAVGAWLKDGVAP
ncbi:MAG: F0F1 ATP synthase subunit alpha, partial [Nitrospirota bacterium]|nr:F0F1 ATP synthase subunit alpha [Nitrospirota bacterium]